MPRPILLSWSSGKDSAWTLHCLRQDPSVLVVGLVTTVNATFDRVAMHGTRRAILEAQANALGLPLHVVPLPWPCTNAEYESAMRQALIAAARDGVTGMAFGDLFLADVRDYRVQLLAGTGIEPMFPIWGDDTTALAHQMIDAGLRAVVTAVDPRQVPADLAGQAFDQDFLARLPTGADPCGENGEFHTCVLAGPMFSAPLSLQPGEVVTRDGFVFADFLLAEGQ
ncbi:ATP-binding protein [Ahniella affigens]|uniref:ATP-binding protein n=1 Tax=Ahniella affigens TaxID=2021234 RepID=A0A2P1PLM4_9GAMM|nr:ATP-binding protein [Ahniella affigens]AVP95730.1 ATP-binding protein [Ahniella affigens]